MLTTSPRKRTKPNKNKNKSKSKTKPLTKQQMFDRAVIGLRSQGWKPGLDTYGSCVYFAKRAFGIHRCAWGWVDPQNTWKAEGSVISLKALKCGMAATLTGKQLEFARELQNAHDSWASLGEELNVDEIEGAFKAVGRKYRLKWPSERRKVTWIKPGEAGTSV